MLVSNQFKKYSKRMFISAAGFLFFSGVKAQPAFTLKQAIQYAYEHTSKVQNALLEEKITTAKVKEFAGIGMPQVKASADMKYFPNVPTQVIPNFIAPATVGAIGGLVQSGALSPSIINNPALLAAGADPKNYPALAAQFGTSYNTSLGANVSWLVADASYFLAKQAQKELDKLMQFNTQRTKIETAEQVSKAYYTALISQKKLTVLQANIDRLSLLLKDTKEYNKQGFIEKLDVDRLQVSFNNLQTEQTKIVEMVALTSAVLKFQMGFDIQQPMIMSDSINEKELFDEQLAQTSFNTNNRLEIMMLNKQIELTRLQLKAREWAWLPNLVAIGSYSTNHYSNEVDFFKHKSKYYPTSLLGVSIGATVFDGNQNKFKKQQVRLQIQQTQNDVVNIKNAFELEIANAKVTLKSAILSIQSQKANMTLAEEIVRVTKIKYQQGVGSNLEVVSAETALKEAQTNYLAALYDAYVAKVNFEKATGTL
jgi:outer membrane protein TolC